MTARPRTPAHRRADRLAQQKKRGSKTSPVTEAEDAKIILAWEVGELTEGQASAALGRDRIGARLMRESFIGSGIALAAALQSDHECPRCGERFAHGKAHNCRCSFRHVDLSKANDKTRAQVMDLVEARWEKTEEYEFEEVHFLFPIAPKRCVAYVVRSEDMVKIEAILAAAELVTRLD